MSAGSRLGGTGVDLVDSPRERRMRLLKRAGQVVISMGDFARGLKLLKSSASLDQECPIPYVNAARAYLGMNDLVAARRQVFFIAHLLCAGSIVQQAIARHFLLGLLLCVPHVCAA